jgi:hypothetical protein
MKKYLAALATVIAFAGAPFANAATAVDPAATEAVKQMMSAMKVREMMVATNKQAAAAMPAQLRQALVAAVEGDTTLTPQKKQEAMAKVESMLPRIAAEASELFNDPTLIDEILAEMVPLYARIYTVDEIHQLSAFYQTPLGQKMLASIPAIATESMAIGNRVTMPRIQKMMARAAQQALDK